VRPVKIEIEAKTEIEAMMGIGAGPANRAGRDRRATRGGRDALATRAEMDALATRGDEVRPHHVQQGSIALRTPIPEQRDASETNELTGNFRF